MCVRRQSPIFAILVIVAILATSCSISPAAIDFDIDPNVVAARVEAEVAELEVNDLGEQILPRVVRGAFKPDDCDLVDVSALEHQPECGWLIRPLHGGYEITQIELPVMIFRSTGEAPSETPLVYLHGGPTDGVLAAFASPFAYEVIVEPFVETRDVIVFDQRGTGLAEPDLRCDSPYQWFNANDEDPETYVSRTAGTCAFDLFQDAIRLDQFSRQSSADDVMVLARELDLPQIDLHGSSWGGLLAYTVMQLHPGTVRSAVLDSPLSVETDATGSMPGSFLEAMEGLQANCDLSPACSQRHGDIVERYIRVFDILDEQPRELLLFDVFAVDLTADELSYLLFSLLYRPEQIAMIPDLLLDLENGNSTIARGLVEVFGLGWGIDFTFLTYMCTDIVPTSSVEQVEAQQIGIDAFDRVDDAPDGRGHTATALCERMKVRKPATPAMRETTPTTPMVVFSGSMDPITPFSSGQRIVEIVPNGTFVGFNDLSHGVTFDPCAVGIALTFLDDPSAELDLTCSLPENRPIFEFGG